ncbi:hypothetical protein PO124_28485 [Bacillus licheniformis]|nr:hypothetical protein [Bacillus licheniformis]
MTIYRLSLRSKTRIQQTLSQNTFSRTQAAKQEKSHHQSHRQPQCHHYAFLAGDPASVQV